MDKLNIKEILLKKKLVTSNHENEAAKLYHQFLLDHPEYENKIECIIESEEREEDHYGNGGGYEYTLIIFKWKEETEEEYNKRISEIKQNLIIEYTNKFDAILGELYFKLRKLNDIDFNKRIISIINKKIDFYIKNSF